MLHTETDSIEPSDEKPTETSSSSEKSYHYKVFRVRLPNGRLSSISMSPLLFIHAVRMLGVPSVEKRVHELVSTWTPEQHPRCSTYVSDTFETELRKLGLSPQTFPPRDSVNHSCRSL